jgi:hypothetical protein
MLRHYVAIGYSGYLRGPAILRDPCFTGLCITPAAGLQYAKFRLTTIIFNRVPQFVSDFWKHLIKRLGIIALLSIAYHPEINGQTELLISFLE